MALVLDTTWIDTQISSVHVSIGVKAFSIGAEFSAQLFGKDILHCFLLKFNTFSISHG
jgi:hypothetical protein